MATAGARRVLAEGAAGMAWGDGVERIGPLFRRRGLDLEGGEVGARDGRKGTDDRLGREDANAHAVWRVGTRLEGRGADNH